MSVKQFNGTYIKNDDRIIFRFNTIDQSEYIFWLTRRITHFILKSAGQFIKNEYEKQTPSVENVISEIQQSDKQGASFTEAYVPGIKFPIGGEAILVLEAKCEMMRVEEQNIFSLDLILPGGGNLNLKLTVPFMKSVALVLEELNIQAKWGDPMR